MNRQSGKIMHINMYKRVNDNAEALEEHQRLR